MSADSDVTVLHNEASSRFEVTLDGARRGLADYRVDDDRWLFHHTEIDPAVDGQGLGSQLIRFALDDVRSRGVKVVPLCPFVAGWIDRHPEYGDLVDQELYERLRSH